MLSEPEIRRGASKHSAFLRAAAATLLVVTLVCAVGLAVARFLPSTQRDIEAAYGKLDAAVRNRDLAAFMSQLSPDYHEQRTMQGKLLSRSDAEVLYKRAFQDWDRIHNQKADIYRITARGDSASVVAERTFSGQVTDSRGVYGSKGRVHNATVITMEVDSWTRSPGGWRMKMRSITSIDILIEGKHLHSGVLDHHHED